jgi:ADP-ribose pyrophosphatase YjhB (NUDIX family)
MAESFDPQWLQWARRLQALAQIGLAFNPNHYDQERYEEIRAIAAEMMAAGSDASVEQITGLFAGQTEYATPKVDTRGVVFQDDSILLVKELSDGGRWTLPGGWADVNESPSQAVEREIREESGFEARVVKLLAVWDRSMHAHYPLHPFHVYKLFFLCEITGGSAATSSETDGAAFFAEDEIPELSVARVTPDEITRLFEHHRQQDLPADFD